MSLLSMRDVNFTFGGPLLLEGIDLQINRGERLCLLGRNGAGKTTLMRLISGELKGDSGHTARQPGIRTALLTQQVPADLTGTVFEAIASRLGKHGKQLAEYLELSSKLEKNHCDETLEKMNHVGSELHNNGAWGMLPQIQTVISHMQLDGEDVCQNLSAGLKRRVLMASTLVCQPDILLLDEPTNHLDVDTIAWMEDFLIRSNTTLVFVSHDRMFLQKLSTRIVEIDRGMVASFDCDYNTYLKRKDDILSAQTKQDALFDKRLAEEEVWIRRGIQARRTRNEGRVRRLMEMRNERRGRTDVKGKIRIKSHIAERSGNLVIEAKDINFSYTDGSNKNSTDAGKGDRISTGGGDASPIIAGLTTTIMRGDKIGIIGPNGCGKTTLLKILLGELVPQQGTVRHGTNIQVAYFDQLHSQLDDDKSVADNVGEGSDTLVINGQPRHVLGYLEDFLFTPSQSRGLASRLSGGERNRLLLAKLFTKPSNVLVLDEPTNDLDVETLDLIEEILVDYPGTVLMVSHDRVFLNNVVTSTLVFEGEDAVKEYVGGYDDWVRQRKTVEMAKAKVEKKKPAKEKKTSKPKLTWKQQKELKGLPERIEKLESDIAGIHDAMGDADFYKQAAEVIASQAENLKQLENELSVCYDRWEKLEELA